MTREESLSYVSNTNGGSLRDELLLKDVRDGFIRWLLSPAIIVAKSLLINIFHFIFKQKSN